MSQTKTLGGCDPLAVLLSVLLVGTLSIIWLWKTTLNFLAGTFTSIVSWLVRVSEHTGMPLAEVVLVYIGLTAIVAYLVIHLLGLGVHQKVKIQQTPVTLPDLIRVRIEGDESIPLSRLTGE